MSEPNNNPNANLQAYFTEQKKSIELLLEKLDSNIFLHHLNKWIFLAAEISLYLVFIGNLILAAVLPTLLQAAFFHEHYPSKMYQKEQEGFIKLNLLLCIVLVFLSLLVLVLAISLRRTRKRRELIRESFNEVENMKNRLDDALNRFTP